MNFKDKIGTKKVNNKMSGKGWKGFFLYGIWMEERLGSKVSTLFNLLVIFHVF